jgi:predicted ATP-grasp superfamily ATP-dependent carboligase
VRALILDGRGARASLAATRALAADGWRVGIAAPRPDGLAVASRRVAAFHEVPLPEHGEEAFVGALARAVTAGGYEVVFASSDVDVLALSRLRARLPAVVPFPEDEALRRGLDKLELTRAARQAGLVAPRTVDGLGTELPPPVVVKERVHGDVAHGGRADTVVPEVMDDRGAVRDRVAEIRARGGQAIVQELVAGRLLAFTVVCDREHRIVARVQQEAMRTWPGDVGSSARARTVAIDESLAAGVQRLLADLGWFGLAELQFLAPAGGPPHVVDLNPRFYGSLALAVGAGVNLPALWARLATGRPVPERTDAAVGVRYQWLEADLRQARQDRRGGSVRADAMDSLRWSIGACHSIWRADDPRPAARAAGALLRARLR